MIHSDERPYSYLIAVGHLIDAVQKIHSTNPGISPLSFEQIHFWLQQISLDDLKNAGPARERERELRERSRVELVSPPRQGASPKDDAAAKKGSAPRKEEKTRKDLSWAA